MYVFLCVCIHILIININTNSDSIVYLYIQYFACIFCRCTYANVSTINSYSWGMTWWRAKYGVAVKNWRPSELSDCPTSSIQNIQTRHCNCHPHNYGGFHKWGIPNSCMVYFIEDPFILYIYKWMITKNTPMTEETSIWVSSYQHPTTGRLPKREDRHLLFAAREARCHDRTQPQLRPNPQG